MKKKSIILFLMGPTAIGKSSLALKIKRRFSQIELLSVDSKLVYRGLDIGTDKPTKKNLRDYSYRLVDIIDPWKIYSVIDFYHDAHKEIQEIVNSGKIPLLVGGTMLYFKVLLNGFSFLPPSNSIIREYIFQEICFGKKENLFQILKKIDFLSSKKFHINDIRRVLRAVEVFFVSGGSPLSVLNKSVYNKFPYQVFQFGLIPHDKNILFNNIKKRFNCMLDRGLEQEVRNLYKNKYLNISLPSINSIGYKQMWKYIENKYTYQEMIDNTIKSTRNLVKHQLTWLTNWKNIILIQDDQIKFLMTLIKKTILRISM
ncbi:tRNA (adenosine(37)-N6)-dimethylallyltransferase MiaA [Buchnera aphidicola]|uniref:tRNA dimethylallyltransferase n=1 Tax=Buchnera aphidicola (Cinara strobi) TaxID=1921549 RepID=A0A3B1DX56_9GAMM|nr:tRNA (adenosine(37)-N6)-dimethylallyltransferase MiaA [Buchnera aphidicola]VAX76883.1 tRNA dimethylallyltransferase [Buchnera aphidicola (Cinara strobi)]